MIVVVVNYMYKFKFTVEVSEKKIYNKLKR